VTVDLVADAAARFRLSPEGGRETLRIRGANFGPRSALGSAPVLFFGPSAESMPLRFSSTCTQPAGTLSHSTLLCPVPAGLGRNLTFVARIGDQDGTRSGGAAEVSYAPPVVSLVSGVGSSNADTQGGQVILATGAFGPAELSLGLDSPSLRYGPASNPFKYLAQACRMIGAAGTTGTIECETAEGVGKDLAAIAYVGGQWGQRPGGSLSYAPPTISGFNPATPGAMDALTVGGEDVGIYGAQLGPDMNDITVSYQTVIALPGTATNGSAAVRGPVVFVPPSACRKPNGAAAHSEMTCTVAPGAGRNLAWTVTVGGQNSSNPTTSYQAPVITAVTLADNVAPALALSTEGGTIIRIQGVGFGPSVAPGPLVQEVLYGDTSTLQSPALAYTPLSSSLLSDGRIEIVTRPGIGLNLRFQVRVADVLSAVSPVTVGALSYGLPASVAVAPATSPTRGSVDGRITISGVNFGLLDSSVEHKVFLGTRQLIVVERFPTLARVQAGTLAAQELLASNHYVVALLPEGVGAQLPARVVAFRRDSPTLQVSSSPAADGAPCQFSYADPAIDVIGVESVSDANNTAAAYNAFGQSVDIATVRVVSIRGTNFGPGTDPSAAYVEIMPLDAFGLPVPPAVYTRTNIAVQIWTHETIKLLTTVGQASLRITVPVTDPATLGTATPVQLAPRLSNVITYFDVSPALDNLIGTPPEGFSTAGGEILEIRARNLFPVASLVATVGNRSCTILLDGAGTPVAPGDVRALIIDAQLATKPPALPLSSFVWSVFCRLPPGQGSASPVVLIRDSMPGTSIDYAVRYAAPSVDSAQVWDALTSTFVPSTAWPARIGTQGGRIALVGSNFGPCPVFVFGLFRGAACAGDALPSDAITVTSSSHTRVELTIPGGWGSGSLVTGDPLGYSLTLTAADQAAAVRVHYARASLDMSGGPSSAITSLAPGGEFPTLGGVVVRLTGSNFGDASAPLPIVHVQLPLLNVSGAVRLAPCTDVVRDNLLPHNRLTCTLPEGSGAALNISVTVGEPEQAGVAVGVLSYARPTIDGVRVIGAPPAGWLAAGNASSTIAIWAREASASAATAVGSTMGGYAIRISGRNFGPAELPFEHCVGLAASASTSVVCNGLLDAWEEGELAAVSILLWSHTNVTVLVPPGMGHRVVRLLARGQETAAAPPTFDYATPSIATISPASGDTEGGNVITLTGSNFGFGPTQDAIERRRLGLAPFVLSFPHPLPLPEWAYSDASTSAQAVSVNFFAGTPGRCISSAVRTNDAVNPVYALPTCARAVLVHTHDRIVFRSLPGIGANKSVSLTLVDFDGTARAPSNAVNFSYYAPEVLSADPSRLARKEAVVDRDGLLAADLETVFIRGRYFGPADTSGWSDDEQLIDIRVGGISCINPVRALRGREVLLACSYGNPAGDPALLGGLVPTVGFKNVTIRVAGQASLAPGALAYLPLFPLHVVCASDSYGSPGQRCVACPVGASCSGYDQGRGTDPEAEFAPIANLTSSGGGVITDCLSCYTRPRALPGFYNLRSKTNDEGESESICHPVRESEGVNPLDCDYVVACDPPEACAGDNTCATGYASTSWPYRCSQCASGFYRSAGTCRRCPNNPALNVAIFFIAALVAIGVGYILNRKMVNVAFLTIGLDYFQVISIFANTRVAWPQEIKDLFRILSAFNLNIELIAPECAIPTVTFAQKWQAVMLLPVATAVVLMLIHSVTIVQDVIKGRRVKLFEVESGGSLAAMSLTLLYFLYLYLTRSIFDVMTCRSTDPPEFDRSGAEVLYMVSVFERCGVPGGIQLALLPGAVAALIVYVILYPGFIGAVLYKNRELVMEDQLLRAKRVGDDRLTNPHAFWLRRVFGRLYYQFKPTTIYWILAILLRKFCIALASLIFTQNQTFQLAAILLVLFIAYTAQAGFTPYMGPGDLDDVLETHRAALRRFDPLNTRLAAAIATVEERGRKRSRSNTYATWSSGGDNGSRAKSARALLTNVTAAAYRFFTNYNTVESLLLASALLVALAGIMFSTAATSTSSFYKASRDAVLASVLFLITITCVYWLLIVVHEIFALVAENSVNKARQRGSQKRAAGEKGPARSGSLRSGGQSSPLGESGASTPQAGQMDSIIGPVDNTTNPMFLAAAGGADKGAASKASAMGLSADSVAAMAAPPDAGLWTLVRGQLVSLMEQNTDLLGEISVLKRALELRGGGGGSGGAAGGDGDEEEEGLGSSSPLGVRRTSSIRAKVGYKPTVASSSSSSSNDEVTLRFKEAAKRRSAGGGGGSAGDHVAARLK
jgi:hypothetical protein